MATKTRCEFPKCTIDKLAKRAAYHCSNCKISTLSASESSSDGYSHTGQAAHIVAASLNGPRGGNIAPAEISAITNGIYLCQICAKLIDANRGSDYPPERLHQIKNDHEKLTRTSTIPISPERLEAFLGSSHPKANASSIDKPDLALRFIYPESPALVLINKSSVTARDIKWTVALWNMDRPERNDPLPIPIGTFDWIKPHDEGGPQNLFYNPNVSPLLAPGDRLFGSASVDSPDCIRGRTYIVYIVWGKSGWFTEIELGEKSGKILIPPNFLKATRDRYFNEWMGLIPVQSRIHIGNK